MSDREQTDAFSNDLNKLVQRYISEFELTVAQAVGVLEVKKHELIKAAIEQEDDDE